MKYPQSQALFTRLLTESGFRKECGQFDKKRFCQQSGMSPVMYGNYLKGHSTLSIAKVKELAEKVGLKTFNLFLMAQVLCGWILPANAPTFSVGVFYFYTYLCK